VARAGREKASASPRMPNRERGDELSFPDHLVAPGDLYELKPRSKAKLFHHELDVNFWANNAPDVEQARPSHCPSCKHPARKPGGRLRLHGHGRRTRTLWGRQAVDRSPGFREIVLRRYRCTECKSVVTVAPRGVFTDFRYSLGAMALALYWWAMMMLSAAETRALSSPWPLSGFSEPERWRSLHRWSERSRELFRQEMAAGGTSTLRDAALRASHLLVARGPPGAQPLERVFIGAHAH